ncbi:UxaA family hydrolase [Bariatricus sp. SGI.154]|uniref:UxaA family hydrolase n=1 Tax=Bariatricus sp. SGI.154 TaxID=3420549 RepID=UPI003D0009E3
MNAMVIDAKDTVAVAIEPIRKGEEVTFMLNHELKTVMAVSDITIYHKLAIKEMHKGEPVVKYGEHIGLAAEDIAVGEHVHVHNVESHREEL